MMNHYDISLERLESYFLTPSYNNGELTLVQGEGMTHLTIDAVSHNMRSASWHSYHPRLLGLARALQKQCRCTAPVDTPAAQIRALRFARRRIFTEELAARLGVGRA